MQYHWLCCDSSVLNFIVTVDEPLRAFTHSDKTLGRLEQGKGNAAAVYPGLLRLNQVYYSP